MLVLVIVRPAQPAYLRYEHGFIAKLRTNGTNSRALTKILAILALPAPASSTVGTTTTSTSVSPPLTGLRQLRRRRRASNHSKQC